MNTFHEVNIIVFFILMILIYDACQEIALNSYSKITIKLTESRRVESWHFRFVKVDTTIEDIEKVDESFQISFTQADTLVIPDSTQFFFVAGTDTIQETIFPDSSFYENDSLIVIQYHNSEITRGIWYLTISTRFKDHINQSFYSKPVWFEIDIITGIE